MHEKEKLAYQAKEIVSESEQGTTYSFSLSYKRGHTHIFQYTSFYSWKKKMNNANRIFFLSTDSTACTTFQV